MESPFAGFFNVNVGTGTLEIDPNGQIISVPVSSPLTTEDSSIHSWAVFPDL